VKRYKIRLSEEERENLSGLVSKGKAAARKLTRARILLQADESDSGPGWTDQKISEALNVNIRTVERVREQCVEEGLERALDHKTPSRTRPIKIDGEVEARLSALACSQPPTGRVRWTLQLLADRMVELEIVESISGESVRKTLKKTS